MKSLRPTFSKILTATSLFCMLSMGCALPHKSTKLVHISPVKTPLAALPVRGVCFSRSQAIKIRQKLVMLKHCKKKCDIDLRGKMAILAKEMSEKIQIGQIRLTSCQENIAKLMSQRSRLRWMAIVATVGGIAGGFVVGYLAVKAGE